MGAGFGEEVQETDGTEGLLKRCRRCEQARPLSDFTPRKYRGDGYEPNCRSCMGLWAKLRKAEGTPKHGVYTLRLSVNRVKKKLRELGAYNRELRKANLRELNEQYRKNRALRTRLTKGGE